MIRNAFGCFDEENIGLIHEDKLRELLTTIGDRYGILTKIQCCGAGLFLTGSGFFFAGSGSSSFKKLALTTSHLPYKKFFFFMCLFLLA